MLETTIMANIRETIFDDDWLLAHQGKIKELFPATWTHVNKINGLQIGYYLKLSGIDWRSEEDFSLVCSALEHQGLILRDGYTIKRVL